MNKKVNLGMQIVWVLVGQIIPFVWIYPFNKIHKIGRLIGWKLLIMGVSIIPVIVVALSDYILSTSYMDGTIVMIPFFMVYLGIGLVDIVFIVKWSMEWNDKLHLSDLHDEVNGLPDINEVSHPE